MNIDKQISQANQLCQEGAYVEAKNVLLSILSDNNNLSYIENILNDLAVISFYLKQYDQAIDYVLKAININPFHKEALLNYYEISQASSHFHHTMPKLKSYLLRFPEDKDINFLHESNSQNYKIDDYVKLEESSNEEQIHISKIKSLISQSQHHSKNYRINKPHRNVLFIGLSSYNWGSIFNDLEGFIFINSEIEKIDLLPELFFQYREEAQNKMNNKSVDEDIAVALYVNIFNLLWNNNESLKKIVNTYGYRMIAFLRDPVQTVATWKLDNNSILKDKNTMLTQMEKYIFSEDDDTVRLSKIWEIYANILWNIRHIVKIYTYEQIVHCSEKVVNDICDFLVLPYPQQLNFNNLKNDDRINQDLSELNHVVKKWCPTSAKFGYNNQVNSIPDILDKSPIPFTRRVPRIL